MHHRIGILAFCAVLALTEPACLLADAAPALTAHAEENAAAGTWGNVSWSIDAEGTLTVSGNGTMGDDKMWHSSTDSPWAYRRDIKRAVIEDGVTNIVTWAFYDCSELTSVTIADSVTEIESGAFTGCGALTSVILPSGLTIISTDLFYDCCSLREVYIPEGVTAICEGAFDGCTALAELTFPESLVSVGAHAFRGTLWLETHPLAVINHILADGSLCTGDVVIPSDVTTIASSAFEGCTGMTSVVIPNKVTSIGSSAFKGCTGLTSIDLPDTLTTLDFAILEDCTELTSLTIPETAESIGSNACQNCVSLTSVIIPEHVTSIGNDAFAGCTSLASVTLPDGEISIGKGAFTGTAWQGENTLIIVNGTLTDGSAAVGDVVIPDTVHRIVSYAFAGNEAMTSVDIPASVTRIEGSVFNNCTGLEAITIRNPYCRIKDDEDTIPENAVIYGYPDSIAQYYAEKYGRTFVALDNSERAGYTYEIIPLMEPFNEYFYVRTDNPDPYSFRFVDQDTVYGDEGAITLLEDTYPDVIYEDAETYRVSGGYIFYGSLTDGGALTLQADTQTNEPQQIPCTNLSTGEVTMEIVRNEIWVDLGETVTLPKLYDDVDYLIENYAEGSDFFSKMDAVQKGFSSVCLYSSSYVRGTVERKADFWSLSNSPHVDQTFYIQSPYSRSGSQSLFAGVLYPFRYDSVGFPSVMGQVAKRLDESAEYAWNSASHYLIDVTCGGETRSYGGQGSGQGQGIDPGQIQTFFTFGDTETGRTLTDTRELLNTYAQLEVSDDVPKEDTLTWDAVCDTVGDGAWVRLVGISSIFGGYNSCYAYLYDTGKKRSITADETGVGGSIYWWGTLGYASDTWVDGRYINDHEIWEPGETFADHPESDIILKQIPFPEVSYEIEYFTGNYKNMQVTETTKDVRFQYDAAEKLWKPAEESMNSTDYDALVQTTAEGQIDAKYLGMVQITSDEIDALGLDRNTDAEPEQGYIYDGTRAAGTVFDINNPPYPLGDVNEDNSVNASDAADILIAAARIGAGETESGLSREQQQLADVNLDGDVNAEDAAVILQYTAAVGAKNFSGTIEEFQQQ